MQKRFSSKLFIENQTIQGSRKLDKYKTFGVAEEKKVSGRNFGVVDKADDG